MLLTNERDETIEIDAFLLENDTRRMVILCRGEMIKDEFITDKMKATFGLETPSLHEGNLESIETIYSALHEDQFILTLQNGKEEK